MFKSITVLEVKAGEDRVHRYECVPESPLGECYDALSAMRSHVAEQIAAQVEKEKEEAKPAEEAKPEEAKDG